MNILNTGYALKLRKPFIQILQKALEQAEGLSGSVILSFKDPEYSYETGGFHPVEIMISASGQIHYITDFSYVGTPPFVELEKELDFDFSLGVFQQFGREYPITEAWELFQVWQKNFCAHFAMDIYQVTVSQA